jgi:hypothetical protein
VRKTPTPRKRATPNRPRIGLRGRIKAWFARWCQKHVRFERRGLQIHVLLEHPDDTVARLLARGGTPKKGEPAPVVAKPPQQPAQAAAPVAQATAEPTAVATWRLALVEVLERHPGARKVLRHLDLLEGALRHHGADALDMLPPAVLRKTANQLDTVLDAGAPRGLYALRASLDATLIRREPRPETRGRNSLMSVFKVGDRVEVEEVGESTFLAAQQSWSRATGF